MHLAGITGPGVQNTIFQSFHDQVKTHGWVFIVFGFIVPYFTYAFSIVVEYLIFQTIFIKEMVPMDYSSLLQNIQPAKLVIASILVPVASKMNNLLPHHLQSKHVFHIYFLLQGFADNRIPKKTLDKQSCTDVHEETSTVPSFITARQQLVCNKSSND